MVEKRTIIRSVAVVGMLGASGLFAAKATILGPSEAQSVPAPVVQTSAVPPQTPLDATTPQAVPAASAPAPARVALAPVAPPAPVPAPLRAPTPAPVQLAQTTTEIAPLTTPETDTSVSALGLPCGLTVTASPMAGAMVALDIMDPCQPNARVEIEHAGLIISARSDALGLLTLDVPALEAPAFFSARTDDAAPVTTVAGIPDLAEYDRVAVMWEGDRHLELHAMELGAEFGGPGHIWDQAPGQISQAMTGQGGFLVELGDADVANPRLAQVYTFPRAGLSMGDSVRMSVDAPITADNCGKPVSATSLQMAEGGAVRSTPIELTLPGCDAVGDYLVLQNLFEDLRLASN